MLKKVCSILLLPLFFNFWSFSWCCLHALHSSVINIWLEPHQSILSCHRATAYYLITRLLLVEDSVETEGSSPIPLRKEQDVSTKESCGLPVQGFLPVYDDSNSLWDSGTHHEILQDDAGEEGQAKWIACSSSSSLGDVRRSRTSWSRQYVVRQQRIERESPGTEKWIKTQLFCGLIFRRVVQKIHWEIPRLRKSEYWSCMGLWLKQTRFKTNFREVTFMCVMLSISLTFSPVPWPVNFHHFKVRPLCKVYFS